MALDLYNKNLPQFVNPVAFKRPIMFLLCTLKKHGVFSDRETKTIVATLST